MTSEIAADVNLVEARRDHIPFIAWTILTAARSHLPKSTFDLAIDRDEPEVLRFLEALTATDTVHFGHCTGFIVAEIDGRSAAALSGYVPSERGEEFAAGLAEAAGVYGQSPEEFNAGMARAGSIFNVIAHPEDDPWTVEWVATHPAFRRRGLIDRLIADILDIGRERGKANTHISVLTGNDAAQRAYEKNGFTVYNESCDADFEAVYGCPGMRYLRRTI